MRTFYLAGTMAVLTALLGACTTNSIENAGDQLSMSDPLAPTEETPAEEVPAATAPTATEQPLFTRPVVSGVQLIPPTDKQEVQQELNQKISGNSTVRDPFLTIPGTVPLPELPQANPTPPPNVLRPSGPTVTVAEPTLPIPTEARAVEVSGVIEIGGEQYAIIAAPNEPTTRYVRAGQRVAGNQVLVKRIVTFGTPVVILEQYGVEVTRPIGEKVAAAPNSNSPTNAPNAPQTNRPAPGVILPPPTATSPLLP
ncbi:hypothetical protein Pse7367_3165 [Thalassoporum mexicanum PCC 7367]|uniref:hypothetical protein n=1 Tax=Thalassoporum mexicanum TaxID=3457544 RepID=UPI00029FF611|nr:hypothetical protein [Pseudanabaena sp. PCC 7367]AFY71413.1 hypothetical protein Pse7367_3165 [Pseudanabaena sp. PCC 7367]